MKTLAELAKSMGKYVLQVRHELHAHPETRWETLWTRRFIADELRRMGFHCQITESGVIADINVPDATERILFRADFDALPVQEETGLPFASKLAGKSHACGHDVGVAMLLGFAKLVADGKIPFTKNLRLLFQDAEENPGADPRPESGAEVAVAEGVCDGISRAYALHIDNHPGSMHGSFRSRPGAMLGNSGRIYFDVKSSGGHVAYPHSGINALRVCNMIMNHLNSFLARNMDPLQPATLEPAVLNAGTGSNIMPDKAGMWYGFRTMLSRHDHEAMAARIEAEIRRLANGMGAEITDVKLIHGHPSLICDPEVYSETCRLLIAAGEEVVEMDSILGGEDFSHIAMRIPSVMFMLGAHTENSGGDHHSPTFNPDESVFWRGVHFWLLLATS